ncbi:hypothetical protein [Arthrobacter sp. N1]|uniref:hypothetical protein n=1 Tax=Arthrobacter sp. N1 TaxID=619291 RepID=UPI003BB1282D
MRLSSRAITALTTTMCASALLAGCASPEEAPAAEKESPLSAFFASAYGGDLSQEEQEKKFAEDEREREELVAQCMSEEGFEYSPNLQSASMSMPVSGDEWDPDSREWVAQYGYGIINYPGRDDMESGGEGEYVDANADYVASLSESEQQAFNEALHGPMPDPEDMPAEGEPMEWDWTTAGCYGWAENERGTAEDPSTSDEHKPLMDAMNTFYETMMTSPELTGIDAEWSSCMADAGHPGFSAQMDAQTSINEEMNKLYESTGEIGTTDDTAMTGGMGMPNQAEMDALGEKEIELALVDLDCREETDYRQKQQEVQFAQEQQFVDDHKTELEAFRADLEQGS